MHCDARWRLNNNGLKENIYNSPADLLVHVWIDVTEEPAKNQLNVSGAPRETTPNGGKRLKAKLQRQTRLNVLITDVCMDQTDLLNYISLEMHCTKKKTVEGDRKKKKLFT